MVYKDNSKSTNENDKKKINLDEVIEDEFNLSKKKTVVNDSNSSEKPSVNKVNLNEDI